MTTYREGSQWCHPNFPGIILLFLVFHPKVKLLVQNEKEANKGQNDKKAEKREKKNFALGNQAG